MNNFDCIF